MAEYFKSLPSSISQENIDEIEELLTCTEMCNPPSDDEMSNGKAPGPDKIRV